MADPEQSIAQAQIEAARREGANGLAQHQQRNIAYLNERIVLFVCCLGMLGVFVVWATASSPWLLYGSFALVILLIVLWGYSRIRRMDRLRAERAREAENWNQTEHDD